MLPCFAPDGAATLPLLAASPGSLAAVLATLPEASRRFASAAGFSAKSGETLLLPGADGLAGALVGLGEGGSVLAAFASAAASLPEASAWHLEGVAEAEAATLGWALGAYRYGRFKPGRMPPRLALGPGQGFARLEAEAVWATRDLINHPANLLGPAELAEAVAEVGRVAGARVTLTEGDRLAEAYPAVAMVGRGSARPPVVAELAWSGAGPDAPLVALCGKGVCFDTGGYDLKPPAAMLRMKKDMGGAAVALGVARLVMQAGLPVRLRLLVGAVENAIGAHAMRPLDVVRTRKGVTVEIGNTDAEGRLVLCDLLADADAENPAILLDFATLTGAARVALGPDLVALFANDDALAADLLAAGTEAEDPLWRLPLWQPYRAWLEKGPAELANVAGNTHAGAVVAALFLERFISPGTPWAHLDLYAWNDHARPGRAEGGEATGLRAVFRMLRRRFPPA
ncbi:leucyl aminopeptidase family protein [Elioraea tepida]|uniref:Leucyl aminopeptidase family protein n=1 Tax=Elioraea tepida TaxID=2843330 RepID=A0A975U121_9PROT|nr:leucyl aminopeptidase family protein [Elioraea tepida]QXM23403.1 leucyl aminopeptidase family protein [Elioraea tepida]